MSEIHIIIVTYNAMKWAERCFTSLRKSSVPVKCIVIDNGSVDGTQEYIKTHFPEVELTQSEVNLGFGKANNIGIEKAYKDGADFFYLMNQDAWLYEDSLEKMLEVYQIYPDKEEIGIMSPIHIDGSEKYLDIFLDQYIAKNYEKTRMISDLYFKTLKPWYEIHFINAAHWLIPKKTIESVGGFNPYFFHYGEDDEYVNRIHFHKKKVILVPGSKVVHDGVQRLHKIDFTKYEDVRIEINTMNPNIANGLQLEKKYLQQAMLKNLLKGNISNYKILSKKYKKISTDSTTLSKFRNQVMQKGPVFLNLS
ncbi:glycosyltransferase family 2 protein [Chryseobacterium carnipullorum]|uniref:Glycosyltransferase family 2 protein n=1 Tax=Chryseobacterium carnipullorum TaxID=1124835 RepID=A0A1M7CC31_CHRCU|nr:glycosyltransferase family 2 protein [Chryseobacterium carnipullorum]AZA47489.1 glycosyltransferase family 2 protein [Chryseobacterium carnipullorum]MDN5478584.1 glycosyltransferase family 2 protein [Chryseobacterium sp.]SHL64449.1 Glycosyltransferase, GT2 family [Chryseobacterium carnipullorum]STD10172.1 dTDP-Rha:alpha-D-GlcNAc-pyrophosphate polyprenol, alpha-3-L-rhamnosyltransferase [Chryseobacterium carnipullorum]